jgi:hypothetical protein
LSQRRLPGVGGRGVGVHSLFRHTVVGGGVGVVGGCIGGGGGGDVESLYGHTFVFGCGGGGGGLPDGGASRNALKPSAFNPGCLHPPFECPSFP